MNGRFPLGSVAAVATLLVLPLVLDAGPRADQHGFGIRLGPFVSRDGRMEDLVGVNRKPVHEAFYRFQSGAHALQVGVGYIEWERVAHLGGGAMETGTLEHVPVSVGYRYHFFRRSAVSVSVGGGLGWVLYDATVGRYDGAATLLVVNETGSNLALEPAVGIELFPSRAMRIAVEARYSWQVLTAADPDAVIDVDLSGWHTTFGIAIMFGSDRRRGPGR